MKTQTKIHAILMASLLTGAFLSQAVQAATCSSPPSDKKFVTATLDVAIACEGLEEGNLAHKKGEVPIDAFGMEWELLDLNANPSKSGVGDNGILTVTGEKGNKAGTWSIDTSSLTGLYNTFVIGLKPANYSGYWNVGAVLSGTYSKLSHGLSHANLYGKISETVVPIPAAVWLFGSGMIGLIGVARRKSAKS